MPARLIGDRWQTATARSLALDAPDLRPALAGQHVDVRLTAEDGYTAQRSYSLSSPAGPGPIEMTVERLDDGEVSPYLVDDLAVGDSVEVRGPIGGWLVWRPEVEQAPVQLIGGGSGVAPLMSMLRTRGTAGADVPFRLLYGVTDPSRVYYRDELADLRGPRVQVDVHYSRQAPPGSRQRPDRLRYDDVERLVIPASEQPLVFVCGPTGFVEAMASALVALGHPEQRVRTERFGPTG